MNSETGPDMCDNNGNKEHYVVSKVTCIFGAVSKGMMYRNA